MNCISGFDRIADGSSSSILLWRIRIEIVVLDIQRW